MSRRATRAVQSVDADHIVASFVDTDTRQPQTLLYDLESEPAAGHGPGSGVGDLSFSDEPVGVANRDLQRRRPRPAVATLDFDGVEPGSGDSHTTEIGHHIGRQVRRGI